MAALAAAALLIAGCGGDDDTTTTEAETTATGGGGAATLTIKMGDFYFAPKNATATAGETKIEAPNEGAVEHELVLFKSDTNPADVPTEADGNADEEKFEEMGAEELGELEAEPGESDSKTFDLTPGKYVMICNLPGHYAQGMYGSLTVTE